METEIGISREEIVAEVETIRSEGDNYHHVVREGPLYHTGIGINIENCKGIHVHEMNLNEVLRRGLSIINLDGIKTTYNQLPQNG